MKNFAYNFIFSIATAITITFVQYVITFDNGTINVGESFLIHGVRYQPIEVENHSRKTLPPIKISVPKSMDVNNIISSSLISINSSEEMINASNKKQVVISDIKENSFIRILVPTQTESCCSVLNSNEVGIKVTNDRNRTNPLIYSVITGGLAGLIYFISIMYGDIQNKNRVKKIELDLSEEKSQASKLQKRIKKQGRLIRKLRNKIYVHNARNRYFLLKRIKEYSKELDFWRGVVSKSLMNEMSQSDIKKTLLKQSELLGTKPTHYDIKKEYDELEENISIANEVSKIEK